MIKTRRLVVIDQNRETGEVLQAVLGGRGTEVTAVRHWHQLGAWSSSDDQTVLVMDAKAGLPESPAAQNLRTLPRVVIGRVAVCAGAETSAAATFHSVEQTDAYLDDPSEQTTECCLDELFEYPDLVSAIEKLWNQAG